MSPAAFAQFGEGLEANTLLTDLFFTHNNLWEGGEGGVIFLKSLANKKELKSLAINSCNLNGDLLDVVKDAIQENITLKELYLFANKIDATGAEAISAMIKNKVKLNTLGLSNNRLAKDGAIEIAKNGLEGKREILKLSIENNVIGNKGLEAICKSLNQCTQMQEFYIYNNEIDDEPIERFCQLMTQQSDLFSLGLEFNRIGYKGLQQILKALAPLNKLERLYLN